MYVTAQTSLYLKGHQSYWIRAHPNTMTSFLLDYISRAYFQIKCHSQLPELRNPTCIWEDMIPSRIGPISTSEVN
jgi:hypothetical protein